MRNLLQPPSEALVRDLEAALRAVRSAMPLSGAHEKNLHFAVRDLSTLLTQDRAELRQSYWINKRLLAAYCRYFLPWNLLRLAWLLPGMDLDMQPGDTILDLGSGPLTLPLALWLTKPAWRAMPITVICADISPAPLGTGRAVFHALAGDSPWKIELWRGSLDTTLRDFSGRAKLICMGNVLNEMRPSRETPLEERLFSLVRRVASRLAPDGRFLAVEPGTRLGGKLIALTRLTAFAAHMTPEAPCPHWGPCPMLAAAATGWCHFSHPASNAPRTLAELARKAGLGKQSLSLSCLLLRRASDEEAARAAALLPRGHGDFDRVLEHGDEDAPDMDVFGDWAAAYAKVADSVAENAFIRILSDPIRLPDSPEPARYGCSRKGLALVDNALRIPSGAAFAVRWTGREERDLKTGALRVSPPSGPAPIPAPAPPSGDNAVKTTGKTRKKNTTAYPRRNAK